MVDILGNGNTFLSAETLALLPDPLSLKVHAQVVFDYVRIELRHVLVAPGKHISLLCEKLLHGLQSHPTADFDHCLGRLGSMGANSSGSLASLV